MSAEQHMIFFLVRSSIKMSHLPGGPRPPPLAFLVFVSVDDGVLLLLIFAFSQLTLPLPRVAAELRIRTPRPSFAESPLFP